MIPGDVWKGGTRTDFFIDDFEGNTFDVFYYKESERKEKKEEKKKAPFYSNFCSRNKLRENNQYFPKR
jgi:hypothetical protein